MVANRPERRHGRSSEYWFGDPRSQSCRMADAEAAISTSYRQLRIDVDQHTNIHHTRAIVSAVNCCAVCTEDPIRVDDVIESLRLVE